MQYNNIVNMRVPINGRKSTMVSSELFNNQKQQAKEPQYLNRSEMIVQQKNQLKETSYIPSFILSKKSQSVTQSLIFNNNNIEKQSSFQNPFLIGKYARASVQQSKKYKPCMPAFFKNQDKNKNQETIGKEGFYKKFKSPQPLKQKDGLFSSVTINKDLSFIRQKLELNNSETYSPVNPKKINDKKQQSFNNSLIYSDKQKQKIHFKNDQKAAISLSQKSPKVPEFLKKNSPQNVNSKQLNQHNLKRSERLFDIKKVSTQNCTQPQSPIQKKPNHTDGKLTNYVQIQNNFSKKKNNQLNSFLYSKISNTPQNIPVKLQFPNFQFGRLSSPSSLNNRRRIDSTYVSKDFSLNDFQLVDKIGKGAFGDVYIAQQKKTSFLCVLKKVSKKKIRQLKLQQSMVREIKIQSYLKHKHLTSLYGFFSDQQYLYLILQILPDGSMNHSKKKKKIPENQVAKYIRQVCDGLRYMHKQQVIHRDLKPQNIFLYQDYLKIGDFGCAIYTQTLRKTVVGCLAYISPEQLNNDFYDDKIDIWSLGILTYELLTGKSPFQQDILKISKQESDAKLSKLIFPQGVEISDPCKNFIQKLLQMNPQNRMSIDQTIKHPFIAKSLQLQRKQENEIFGGYQAL